MSTKKIIEKFISKKIEIIIDEEPDNIEFVDWDALCEKMNESYNEIFDYFINDDDCEEKITNGAWKPFGLLGLMHNPYSYAEMGNSGLLLFDLSKGNESDPAVILWRNDEVIPLVDHFSELELSEVED